MDFSFEEFLNREFLENSYRDYALFLGILFIGLIFKLFISKLLGRSLFILVKRLGKHVHHANEFVELLRKPLEVFFVLLILLLAFNQLSYPTTWHLSDTSTYGLKNIINKITEAAFVLSITWVFLRVIDYFAVVFTKRESHEATRAAAQVISFSKELIKILLVIFSLFFILGSVFHVNVASLIAGLGIGGLAIALAAQETLANLFGSFVIFLDKPFEVGDMVRTDKFTGHIEQIGFRSTKIRTLEKNLLIVPNKVVSGEVLTNITKSSSRRIRLLLGLSHNTKREQIKQIIRDINDAINNHPQTFENYSVLLDNFTESAFQIEVIFFTMSNDGDIMSEVKQDLIYRIMEIIEKNEAVLAIPVFELNALKDIIK